jgi:hypothetical protein
MSTTKTAKPAKTAPVAKPEVKTDATAAEVVTEAPTDKPAIFQLTRLDRARALPEVGADVETEPASKELTAIQSFKSEDHRTMNVVLVDGALAQQELAK